MSDTLIAAIVTAVVILVPFAHHLITKYRERRRLRVSLWFHDFPLPAFLKKHLADLYYTACAQDSSLHQQRIIILTLSNLRGYIKLNLHNPSKKTLNSITVTLTGGSSLYQIEDQSELHAPDDNRILLGDLQPEQRRTLHIWTTDSSVGWSYNRLAGFFEITADEFDKRTLKFPFPFYLKLLLQWRVTLYMWWFSGALLLFALLFWIFRP